MRLVQRGEEQPADHGDVLLELDLLLLADSWLRWETVKCALGSWPLTIRLVIILAAPSAAVALVVMLR